MVDRYAAIEGDLQKGRDRVEADAAEVIVVEFGGEINMDLVHAALTGVEEEWAKDGVASRRRSEVAEKAAIEGARAWYRRMDAADTKLCGDPEFARTWGIGSIAEIDVETLEDVTGFEADPGHAASSRIDMVPDPMPSMPARRWRRRRALAHDDDGGANPTPCRKHDHASGPTKAKKMKKTKKPIKQRCGDASIVGRPGLGRNIIISRVERCGPWEAQVR